MSSLPREGAVLESRYVLDESLVLGGGWLCLKSVMLFKHLQDSEDGRMGRQCRECLHRSSLQRKSPRFSIILGSRFEDLWPLQLWVGWSCALGFSSSFSGH